MQLVRYAHVLGNPRFRLCTPCGLPTRNLSRELVLVAMSQITCFTSFNEMHALAMFGPYKENQQYLSMKMLHCRIMPLKHEALQHLWQTLRFLFTLII
jgi:hypothetical protein